MNNLQKISMLLLLKIILLQQVHIDQHKAETLMRNLALSALGIPFNQLPNIFVILIGGGRLYVNYIMRQIIRTKGQEMNRC
jgi:hypothetical protein